MNTNASFSTVGIVGLGLVGTALAGRLAQAGVQVRGYDIRETARAAFAEAGGTVEENLGAMAGACGCIVLAVFDTAGVLDVVEGPSGLLQSPAASLQLRALIDCSTGEPDTLAALAVRLKARDIDFIEAPLSGSSQQIAAGEATLLLGGEAGAIARLAPLLEAIALRRIHVGGAGAGARAKLATNLVLGLNRAALAEGMVFAERLGIAPAHFLELVLATPARSAAAEAKGAMMVRGEFEPQSRIRQHLKDVDLMIAAAREAGQGLPLSQAHAQLMRDAVAEGDGELDNAGIIRQMRRVAPPPATPEH